MPMRPGFLLAGLLPALALTILYRQLTAPTIPMSELMTWPEDTPAVYITGPRVSVFNAAGEKELSTFADSLASYADSRQHRLLNPRTTILEEGQERWQISAAQATVLANDDVLYETEVIATELTGAAVMIRSDTLLISEQGDLISSDGPVEVSQGAQRARATGMQIQLGSSQSVVELLADVSFHYEPN